MFCLFITARKSTLDLGLETQMAQDLTRRKRLRLRLRAEQGEMVSKPYYGYTREIPYSNVYTEVRIKTWFRNNMKG